MSLPHRAVFSDIKKTSDIDGDHYIGEDLPFLVYDFDGWADTDFVTARLTKLPKAGGSVFCMFPVVSWLCSSCLPTQVLRVGSWSGKVRTA